MLVDENGLVERRPVVMVMILTKLAHKQHTRTREYKHRTGNAYDLPGPGRWPRSAADRSMLAA